ncbi:MAG: UDP-N-acetylmuramate--alanine ligase [Chlorobium sp.]|uniref:UDP-N-acetylmuramate--L-alanine ligase n=1 Tax=Chlorobium sp. TaxID=1095 RepID=UPI0025C53826|nr:Mur ligase family protein [Chlorobium sp.]MCF8215624.1 UDP-N-acetylmuramate--alanine ligase [Chlorobium sp.]MCF8270679.1 UDP-N-acetylmuramate--alanine ligase [Chlorobium sp.]MCF8286833.1 UDP-N-acetylmuramate--alanine ligase [Chlorobium sp.]MCF8290591.1 UDP-N-acetylmuramate--alanine ligase [Chlorobium sp.]MCF8384547.1 UDP-N-acetylmuramate--alanine ligase [Chlorobium sp.]
MSSIYFLGIGGTAMASVAVALSHLGHAICGSDTALYPPMSTYLETNNIRYFKGFSEKNISGSTPDLVVVGNAVSRGNCELEYALNHRLQLISMPELVRNELIAKNTSLVVTGTHGKTTTTSILAWLLEYGGLKPGFLIGGIPENFSISCRASGQKEPGFFVTEGDEYDTSFFDKRSKFMLYRPDIAIINNMEFDHADIFDSFEDIRKSFRQFVNLIPGTGILLVNGDDPAACEASSGAFCPVERFGFSDGCDWSACDIFGSNGITTLTICKNGKPEGTLSIPLAGRHNIMNALGAIAAATHCGLHMETITCAMPQFRRPKRRMEVTEGIRSGLTLIEDFAHHPTAIRATLEAITELCPGRRIIACFEPRSNTTTRNIFQQELAACFGPASIVVLGKVHRPERYAPDMQLDVSRLECELQEQNKSVFIAGTGSSDYPGDIVGFLESVIEENDVVVLMSNGSFSNLKTLFLGNFGK